MARLVKEIGTGPIGIDIGANMHVTAVISAVNVSVYILFFFWVVFKVVDLFIVTSVELCLFI